jgi:hypothetical protein
VSRWYVPIFAALILLIPRAERSGIPVPVDGPAARVSDEGPEIRILGDPALPGHTQGRSGSLERVFYVDESTEEEGDTEADRPVAPARPVERAIAARFLHQMAPPAVASGRAGRASILRC